jgi:hypothetical protein
MVEVAPNKFLQLDLAFQPPATVFCDVVPIAGQPGAYNLVPRSWERLERVTADLCEKMGLGRETLTLRRLIRTGFVDGSPVAPKVYNVNIVSFFNHMKRCAENPDFWQEKQRAKYLRSAY